MSAIDTHVHFDGDYTRPVQDGPWIPVVDNETQSTLYKADFWQIAKNFSREKFGTLGPFGASLVEEGEGTYLGGPLVKWTRTYASIPSKRSEPEGFVYNYQIALVGGSTPEVLEFPLFVTSTVVYEYFLTATPATITAFRSYRVQVIGGVLYAIGVPPATGATELVAENSRITRWKGNIWQRATRYVPLFTAAAV